MHRATETLINAKLLLILLGASISSANILTHIPKNNPLNIDWDPAPSPQDGPPLSAGASRDKALLPAQIGGIVGAYLFSVCIVGIALILLGRRLRLKVQHSTKVLDIEMVHQTVAQKTHFDPSPVSPGSPRNFSWPSPDKDTRNPYIFPSAKSPTTPVGGDPYVETRIVEADREMMQRDLEDIYAHVMEQEEAKAAGAKVKEMPPPLPLQRTSPVPAPSPQRQGFPHKGLKSRPSDLNLDEPKPKSHSRTSSIISSLVSPRRKGMMKNLRISSPIPTPLSATFPKELASDEEPLSPRYYTPPPPPPVPKDQLPYTHSRNVSNEDPSSRSIAEKLESNNPYDQRDETTNLYQPRHRPNPSQVSVASRSNPGDISATSATSQTPLFLPPAPKYKAASPSLPNNSSTRALPFRQFESALASPTHTGSTKTTVLERAGPQHSGPMTAGLKTPWSAGAVPYSPYQPFTPIMPITPRLVTKEERKAKKKQEGRAPVLEMIKSEDELWDSGY